MVKRVVINKTTKHIAKVIPSKIPQAPKIGLGLLGDLSPGLGVDLSKHGLIPARPEQTKEIYSMFMQHKDMFPHLRQDYIKRKIETQECVLYGTSTAVVSRYKKKTRLGDCHALRGDWIIHQVTNTEQGNGDILKCVHAILHMQDSVGGDAWACIRSANPRSRGFFAKVGFKEIGEIMWANGALPGVVVYRKGRRL
jgi:hypothetical protein